MSTTEKKNQIVLDGYVINQSMSERINILRAVFIIMVVFIHSKSQSMNFKGGTIEFDVPQSLEMLRRLCSSVISSVAVPGFFLFSGILLYRKPFSWKENMKKKVRTLIIPYLLCNIIWIAAFFIAQLFPVTAIYFSKDENIISHFNFIDWINAFLPLNVFKNEKPFLYPFWYIHNLIFMNLFAIILKKIMDKAPKIWLCLLAVLWLSPTSGWLGLYKQSVVFFCLGYYFVKYHITFQKIDEFVNFKAISALYAGTLLLCFFKDNIGFLHIKYVFVLVSIIFWIRLSSYLKTGKLLHLLASYQFIIYGFHEFTLTVFSKLAVHLFPQTALLQCVVYIVMPFVIITGCVIVGAIVQNLIPGFYKTLTGGR